MQNRNYKSGFTVVELLVVLAIMGILMATVALAFNASMVNYRANENIFRTINNARQALSRITSQIRTADAVDPNSPSSECALITAGGNDITFRYDSTQKKLYLRDNNSTNEYLLCDNVNAMNFEKSIGVDDGMTYVKSVQASMTVQSGNMQRTVSAAAVVRRNLQ